MAKILNNIKNSPIQGLSSLKVTSSFGNRTFFNGKTGKNEKGFHSGIDLIGGKTIVATANGKVISVRKSIKGYDENNSAGNYVMIYHGNNVYTKYCHLKYGSIPVYVNDIIKTGTIVGTAGSTGHATGVHLHYAIKVDGSWVNPKDYLLGKKILPNLDNNITNNSQTMLYKVKKGDTLSKIAIEYKTTVSKLVKLNNIKNPNLIFTGSNLIIPINNSEKESNANIYIVKKGDTLSKIAKKYNTTWQKIYNKNKNIIGKNPNLIIPGQKIIIEEE